jgi:hypothetical protein
MGNPKGVLTVKKVMCPPFNSFFCLTWVAVLGISLLISSNLGLLCVTVAGLECCKLLSSHLLNLLKFCELSPCFGILFTPVYCVLYRRAIPWPPASGGRHVPVLCGCRRARGRIGPWLALSGED